MNSSYLLLDTCCVLNLCASGYFLAILESIPSQVVIAQEIQRELKKIENLEQFECAIAQGLLLVVDFASDPEEERFVNYAAILDDGEAATGAIAIQRGWQMATDEKKALKFFTEESPELPISSTLQIIKDWSETNAISPAILQEMLEAIRKKSRYMPPQRHPLYSWWQSSINLK